MGDRFSSQGITSKHGAAHIPSEATQGAQRPLKNRSLEHPRTQTRQRSLSVGATPSGEPLTKRSTAHVEDGTIPRYKAATDRQASETKVLVEGFKNLFKEMSKPVGIPQGAEGEVIFGQIDEAKRKSTESFQKFFKENKDNLKNNPEALEQILGFVDEEFAKKDGNQSFALMSLNALESSGLLKADSEKLKGIVVNINTDLIDKTKTGTDEFIDIKLDEFGTLTSMESKGLTEKVGYAERLWAWLGKTLSNIADIIELKGYEFLEAITPENSSKVAALEYLLQRPEVESSKLEGYLKSLGRLLAQQGTPIDEKTEGKILSLLLDGKLITNNTALYVLCSMVSNRPIAQERGNHIATEVLKKLPELKGSSLRNAFALFGILAGKVHDTGQTRITQEMGNLIAGAVLKQLPNLTKENSTGAVHVLNMLVQNELISKEMENSMAEAVLEKLPKLEGHSLLNALTLFNMLIKKAQVSEEMGNRIAEAVLGKLPNLAKDDLNGAVDALVRLAQNKLIGKETENRVAEAVLKKLPELEGHGFRNALTLFDMLIKKTPVPSISKEMGNRIADAVLKKFVMLPKADLGNAVYTLGMLAKNALVSKEMEGRIAETISKGSYRLEGTTKKNAEKMLKFFKITNI